MFHVKHFRACQVGKSDRMFHVKQYFNITQILKHGGKNTMKTTVNAIFAIINLVTALRLNTCILCGCKVKGGSDVVKIRTAKNIYAICPDCFGPHCKTRKSADTSKKTVGKLTVYNDIIGYNVNVITKKPETRAYIMCNNGWTFSDHIETKQFVANYNAVNFQALSPMLDSIFTNDDTVTVRVNNTICNNTEEVRDAIEMKIRNAKVNKSVK